VTEIKIDTMIYSSC